MRCDQCKHWEPEEPDWQLSAIGFGRCGALRHQETIEDEAIGRLKAAATPYDQNQLKQAQQDALRGARAYTVDGSGYRADVYTGPDFFCALFAAAETQKPADR